MTVLFTVLGLRRERVLSCWIIMEINIISFIMVLFFEKKEQNFTLSYFIIQRVTSRMLLLVASVAVIAQSSWTGIGLIAIIGIKIGAFPFLKWYIYMVKHMSWNSIILLSTIQKLIPLYVISNMWTISVATFIILGGAAFSVIVRWGETEVKKIIALSRVFNLSWMIVSCSRFQYIIMFFGAYFVGLTALISALKSSNIWRVRQIASGMSQLEKACIFCSLLRIAGFPPLAGFWAKLSLAIMFYTSLKELILILIILTVLIMYVYINISIIMALRVVKPNPQKARTLAGGLSLLLISSPIFIYL